ncbi:MAG: tripartite tricarboxylate transporter substrate binding protein [Pseudomonadota bacterium]
MNILKRYAFALALPLAATLATPAAFGAEPAKFPGKLVTLVVPFTPTSGSDIIARIIAPKLSALWGQPVIVDNRPGASGNIGTHRVATAAPDGHTLLMAINTFTMTPSLYNKLPYDPVAGFAPVAKLAEASYVMAVNPSVPVTDIASLIAYIKKNPGKVNYGTPGNGTPQHLAMELFKKQYGLNTMHVPYKGLQGAVTDLIGGQVQMMMTTVQSVRSFGDAGKVRMIAVTGAARSPLAPNVPTFKEQGVTAMDNIEAWYAVLAPAGTPPELVKRLNHDFISVLNQKDVKDQLTQLGMTVRSSSPEELGALVKAEIPRWKQVIAAAGITAN